MKYVVMFALMAVGFQAVAADDKPGVGMKAVDCAKILSAKKAKQQGQAPADSEAPKPAPAAAKEAK